MSEGRRGFRTTQSLKRFDYGPRAVTAPYVASVVGTGSGTGTVTSVAAGTGLAAIPSPVTGAGTISLTVPVSVANGGTGATTPGGALANLGGIGGNQTITLGGDLSGSGTTSITATLTANSVVTTDITNANVTYAKIQNVAAQRLLGNPTAGAAAPSEISLGTGLSFAGAVLNVAAGAGTVTSIAAGTGITVSPSPIVGAGTVSLATPVSVANGGTGLAAGTSGGIPYYNTTTSLASSAVLTANALVKGGGAGGAPVASTATVDGSGNLSVVGSVTANAFFAAGTVATFSFEDRATPGTNTWQVYATGGSARFFRGADKLTIDGSGNVTAVGWLDAGGRKIRPGTAGPSGGSLFNINWTGTAAVLWIDAVNVGTIAFTSDYRIKENVAELPSMWDRVKAMRPISYTIKDTDDGLFRAEPAERWGFIAHELQETLTPSAATGHKDEPNLIQSIDLPTLLAATVGALQEAMTRIEALEAQTAR